jgi:DNA repair exonuclease SbcCD ATPase subunit
MMEMNTMFKELEESSKEVDKEWEKLEETKSRVMSGIEERHKILNQLLSSAPTYTFEELERDEDWNNREAEIRKRQEEISSMLDNLRAD